MIKVLVVDDDRLVRKGLISAMPWADFDMRVVGEAGNGADALEFLANHPVDLIMVDLAMPVMSGIELMRLVSRRFPHVYMVVLTFHQEFEYVQEALRLGALDYIAKLQLEREQFEEVLQRITQRISRERDLHGQPVSFTQPAIFTIDQVFAVLSAKEQAATDWMQTSSMSALESLELDDGLWLLMPAENDNLESLQARLLAALPVTEGWRLLRLAGLRGENYTVVYRQIRKYRQDQFFYEDNEAEPLIRKTFSELLPTPPALDEPAWEALKTRWLSLKWITGHGLFAEMLAELHTARLSPAKRVQLILLVQAELNQLCAPLQPLQPISHDRLSRWADLETWLKLLREQAQRILTRQSYSEEVNNCVLEAVKIVMTELDMPLTVQYIATRVNVSRSYFSQVFRDVTGRPFHEYLRQARIDRAKKYLLHTDQPVHWVALHTGFADEKYFSQIFREHTRLLPSEFRKQGRNSSAVS